MIQVMVMKESAMPLSSPSPVPRRSLAKSQEQPVNLAQALALALVPEAPVSSVDPIENGDNQGSEGISHASF